MNGHCSFLSLSMWIQIWCRRASLALTRLPLEYQTYILHSANVSRRPQCTDCIIHVYEIRNLIDLKIIFTSFFFNPHSLVLCVRSIYGAVCHRELRHTCILLWFLDYDSFSFSFVSSELAYMNTNCLNEL